jgi:predicted NUDIX family NTP pyrophosphohydrolase
LTTGSGSVARRSAGILLYRLAGPEPEVLLVHPGGPFWARKDEGVWSIPKGEYTEDEDPRAAAVREFAEELGSTPPADDAMLELGTITQRSGKVVTAFAVEGDLDPAAITSNTFAMEWPPRSGQTQEFPEVDRAGWFAPAEARQKLVPAQAELVDRLLERLG